MAISPYFKNFTHRPMQRLINNTVMTATKAYGYEIWYIPRDLTNVDEVFGEDPAATFSKATKFEVFIKNPDGYGGEGQFFSKFGLDIRQNLTLYVQKTRFLQSKTDKITAENGFTYQLETADMYEPLGSSAYILEGNENPYQITFDSPREGDLVYFPLANRLMIITFCDDDEMFWPMGTLPVYTMMVETFDISHEKFQTGNASIDDLAVSFSGNALDFRYLNEDGTAYLSEKDGVPYIKEDYSIEQNDAQANNSVFDTWIDDVVDWTDKNPLIERNGKGEW
jgi:hypothetical protein